MIPDPCYCGHGKPRVHNAVGGFHDTPPSVSCDECGLEMHAVYYANRDNTDAAVTRWNAIQTKLRSA